MNDNFIKSQRKKRTFIKEDTGNTNSPNGISAKTRIKINNKIEKFEGSQNTHDLYHGLKSDVFDSFMQFNPDSKKVLEKTGVKAGYRSTIDFDGEKAITYLQLLMENAYSGKVTVLLDRNNDKHLMLNGKSIKNNIKFKYLHPSLKEGDECIILAKKDIANPTDYDRIGDLIYKDLIGIISTGIKQNDLNIINQIFEKQNNNFRIIKNRANNTKLIKDIKNYLKFGIVSEELKILNDFISKKYPVNILDFISTSKGFIEIINGGVKGEKNSYVEDDKYIYFILNKNGPILPIEDFLAKCKVNYEIFDPQFITNSDNQSSLTIENLVDSVPLNGKVNQFENKLNALADGKYVILNDELKVIISELAILEKKLDNDCYNKILLKMEKHLNKRQKEIEIKLEEIKHSKEFKKLFNESKRIYGYTSL